MARANGNGVNRGVDPYSVDRDKSKHWCAQCHGNPACPRTGAIRVADADQLARWKAERAAKEYASQQTPYKEGAPDV